MGVSNTATEMRVMEEAYVNMHGQAVGEGLLPPVLVTEFDVNARLTFTEIKAHEYTEQPESLKEKVRLLAKMIRAAKNCVAYTGAGISTAAGIDDYATKAGGASVTAANRPQVKDWKNARPTYAHHVMAAMHKAGYLKHWIQQNHDSLPQKAGFPQHALNEIHGSLHDPANPVVPYYGELRDDLFQWMQRWEYRGDLCLAVGTSLSGMNADRVAHTAISRHGAGKSQGLVIINLQGTEFDKDCALRIFAKVDDVMQLLAEELVLTDVVPDPATHTHVPAVAPEHIVQDDVFLVPFAADGSLASDGSRVMLDLRPGARLRVTAGPYEGDVGFVVLKNEYGHYRIRFEDSIDPTFNVKRRPFSLWLGNWWIEELTNGRAGVPGAKMPVVNETVYVPDAQ
eukprot:TRINITY_DN29805_c0_g1_i1.p1 TRINITY_DN29805_c0_g1~~TRINITY_DN29805_c0_g1_i1.p1  ORF type:complete len:397 (+),score=109.93 TRINITY_DN29805_c0_g1_i1:51-1241(+)